MTRKESDLSFQPEGSRPSFAPAQAREQKPFRQCCLSSLILLVVVLLSVAVLIWKGGDWLQQNVVDPWKYWKNPLWAVKLEQEFRAETLRIASTNGNELTLVTHERREVFEQKSVGIVPFLNRPVPFTDRKTTVAFPATYRYHVLLNDPWSIETAGQTLLIRAPMIRPTLPVAFDTAQVETDTKGWWITGAWADSDKEALKVRITEKLATQAQTKEMIDAVRDQCRDSLAKFVKDWLLKEHYWIKGGLTEIKVLFPDESEELLQSMKPVLRLEGAEEHPAVKLKPSAWRMLSPTRNRGFLSAVR